jgi:hypothetical protein
MSVHSGPDEMYPCGTTLSRQVNLDLNRPLGKPVSVVHTDARKGKTPGRVDGLKRGSCDEGFRNLRIRVFGAEAPRGLGCKIELEINRKAPRLVEE